jgi:hypothetical protein
MGATAPARQVNSSGLKQLGRGLRGERAAPRAVVTLNASHISAVQKRRQPRPSSRSQGTVRDERRDERLRGLAAYCFNAGDSDVSRGAIRTSADSLIIHSAQSPHPVTRGHDEDPYPRPRLPSLTSNPWNHLAPRSGDHQTRSGRTKANQYRELLEGRRVRPQLRGTDTHLVCDMNPGDIISLAFHMQAANMTLGLDQEHVSTTGSWGFAMSKFRKFVVLQKWTEHCIAVPILTYADNGLRDRPNSGYEYVHIRDEDDNDGNAYRSSRQTREPEENEQLDGLRLVRARRDAYWSKQFIRAPSVVKLTAVTSLQHTDMCSLEGRIQPSDTAKLGQRLVRLLTQPYPSMYELLTEATASVGLDGDPEPGETVEADANLVKNRAKAT